MEQLALIPATPYYYFYVDATSTLHIDTVKPKNNKKSQLVIEGCLNIKSLPHCKVVYIGNAKIANIHSTQTTIQTDLFKFHNSFALMEFLSDIRNAG